MFSECLWRAKQPPTFASAACARFQEWSDISLNFCCDASETNLASKPAPPLAQTSCRRHSALSWAAMAGPNVPGSTAPGALAVTEPDQTTTHFIFCTANCVFDSSHCSTWLCCPITRKWDLVNRLYPPDVQTCFCVSLFCKDKFHRNFPQPNMLMFLMSKCWKDFSFFF